MPRQCVWSVRGKGGGAERVDATSRVGRGAMGDLSRHVEEQSISGPGKTSFGHALFVELNEEYRHKRVQPTSPPITDVAARKRYKGGGAANLATYLEPHKDLRGARLRDSGCGRGDLAVALAEALDCDVLGVDVHEYPDWEEIDHPRVKLCRVDFGEAAGRIGFRHAFDAIVSISVPERVRRPFEAFEGLREVLRPDGVACLKASLYRGPLASHRYRDVYFPWPHLLFHDEVFRQYAEWTGQKYEGAAWGNRFAHLHYFGYFERMQRGKALRRRLGSSGKWVGMEHRACEPAGGKGVPSPVARRVG